MQKFIASIFITVLLLLFSVEMSCFRAVMKMENITHDIANSMLRAENFLID